MFPFCNLSTFPLAIRRNVYNLPGRWRHLPAILYITPLSYQLLEIALDLQAMPLLPFPVCCMSDAILDIVPLGACVTKTVFAQLTIRISSLFPSPPSGEPMNVQSTPLPVMIDHFGACAANRMCWQPKYYAVRWQW